MREFGRAIRNQWLLEEGMTFLNHGSFGATPRRVLAAQERCRVAMERQPLRFFLEEAEPALNAVRTDLAQLLGARPQDLGFVTNATHGANAVIRSLPLRPGDELVGVGHLYPSVDASMDYSCRRAGATMVRVGVPFPLTDVADVLQRVDDAINERTRLLVVDHVTSVTALVLPVAAFVALARRRGVPILVDGAHAPGMLPLDLDALGADYYVGNCHKWLCSAKGCGFLWAHPDRPDRSELHPPAISLLHSEGFPREFDWTGTADYTPWLSLPEALAFHRELGPERVRRHNRDLVLAGGRLCADAWDLPLPTAPEFVGSMIALPCPVPCEGTKPAADALRAELWGRHRIEAMPVPAAGRAWIRVSAQVYNDLDDFRRLAEALG